MIIYKYLLDLNKETVVAVTESYKVLTVDTDRYDDPCVWIEVEQNADRPVVLHFNIEPTGHPLTVGRGSYIGSIKQLTGFIWHVYLK